MTGLGSINLQNFANIYYESPGVSLTDQTLASTSIQGGQAFWMNYTINNPNADSPLIQIGLGASIRLHGTATEINDTANDLYVTLPGGLSNQSRQFAPSLSLTPGSYDVIWKIWMGPPGLGNLISSSGWQMNQLQVTSPNPTPTPSSSPTPIPSLSPSPTPSPTPTSTPSPSSTPTVTPTLSPSPTPTPSPSPTPSPTPTPSLRSTPTATPFPKPTPSPTPTSTPTPTPSPSSPTPAPTPAPTPSLSPTPTPSPSPTATPISSLKQKPTPTAKPTPTPLPAQTPTIPIPTTIQATTNSGATVELPLSGNITSSQMSDITISANQSSDKTTLSFTITGQSGSAGIGNVTIPKDLVTYGTTPTIYIDNQLCQNQGYTEDSANYYVW